MRALWLTAKIAAIFAVLLALTLLATSQLFGRVVGRDVVQEIITARADAGTVLAEEVEELLQDTELEDPTVAETLRKRSREMGIQVALVSSEGLCVFSTRGRRAACGGVRGEGRRPLRSRGGRVCEVGRRSPFEVFVPILDDGVEVATLAMTTPDQPVPDRGVFVRGLARIGAAGLLAAVLLSLYLTAPLRRMSRSMDRVADGDLDHRVRDAGRDEVASMGRSFNSMANRIQGMIQGQKELMAGVSHELRSPLARMKLSLELLRAQGADEGRIRELEGEVDALDGMVEELLVASRLDLGEASLDPQSMSLDEAMTEAWCRVATCADEADMELRTEVDEQADRVHADRALVVRVLGNLFENAVRHGGEGPVSVRARRQEDRVEIAVSDHGKGVPDEQLGRLFETFYRADPSRSRRTGGTGLGLMIVRRAIEAHGGQVRAENDPQGGLRVIFDLPCGDDEPGED